MELASVHSLLPIHEVDLARRLRSAIPIAALDPRASLAVSVGDPWRPCDVFRGLEERMAWSVRFDLPRGHLFTERGSASLGRGGLLRRHAPVHPAELFLRSLGEGLFTYVSDAARSAYVAVYRERQLRWSLLLEDHVRVVRCDGSVVMVEEPPTDVPEVDRTGVLLAGLRHWLREEVHVDDADRYVLVELLASVTPGDGVPLSLGENELAGDLRGQVGGK